MVSKQPENAENYRNKIYYYQNARNAFRDVLENLMLREQVTILLPSFIGYSPKEGSGVYDPIRETNVRHSFYRMTGDLLLDVDDIERNIRMHDKVAILLIHYWGFVDPNINEVLDICHKNHVIIIEDSAHGIFSEYRRNDIGRSDYVIYSYHKMFPVGFGGGLKVLHDDDFDPHYNMDDDFDFSSYDFKGICEARRRNYVFLENLLIGHSGFRALRPSNEYLDSVPQTFPILLDSKFDRYDIYLKLNEMGHSVVSLYHTLIPEITRDEFPNSHKLSKGILNFQIHQDVMEDDLRELGRDFLSLIH